ncbi:MAG: 50S ribosomal protein L18 [Thermoanaerobaculia bacterium]|nr:50S ribosomal protein L18 [Thermoanaerobaculia bacterium]
MNKSRVKRERRQRARRRIRGKVRGTGERPRLAVYKSLRYVYAQLIDDDRGATLAQASSAEPAIREKVGSGTKGRGAARLVGETVAQRAKEAGITEVVFDRGGYIYHGKVREVAEGARENGLAF